MPFLRITLLLEITFTLEKKCIALNAYNSKEG